LESVGADDFERVAKLLAEESSPKRATSIPISIGTQGYGESKMMRTLILVGLLMAPRAVQAQTFEFGPGGFRVAPHGGGDCRELRAACMHKEELGETDMGNCQRYRELCTGGARAYSHHHWHGYEEQ
jgi:hypothetical protein